MYCDNLSAIYLTANPALHSRSKHFDVDYHYVRERVAHGALVVKHISSSDQLADIFTKPLPYKTFSDLRYKLGVSCLPATSLRGHVNMKSPSEAEAAKHHSVKFPNQTESLTSHVQQADTCIKHSIQRLPPVSNTHALQMSKTHASKASMPRTEKPLQNVPLFNRFQVLEIESC